MTFATKADARAWLATQEADLTRGVLRQVRPEQTVNGNPVARSNWSSMFRRAAAAAGRPDLRSHDLRHTGATLAAATGATLADLMARLGHSSPRAALIYQHATEEGDARIAEELSRLAGGAKAT